MSAIAVHTIDFETPEHYDACIEGIDLYLDVAADSVYISDSAEDFYARAHAVGQQCVQLREADSGELISSVAWLAQDKGARLMRMATAEKFQRRGFGLFLLEEVEQQVRDSGLGHMILNSTAAGARLYDQHGFKRVESMGMTFRKTLW